MNRIEKLMKALPEGADAALITSDVNRRYFTGLGSTAGTLLAFRDAAYFIIDFRYIEVAKATVTGAEVILQDKLYDQLGELLKKHGARTVAIETDYITVGSLEQYRSRLPQVEFLTAAITAACADTEDPVKQGLISMTGVFFDTMVICTVTGLAICCSGTLGTADGAGRPLTGAALTLRAFETVLGPLAPWLIGVALGLFAFTSVLGCAVQAETTASYLLGPEAVRLCRVLYGLAVFAGAVIPMATVLQLADLANALMAFPNLVCLLLLSGEIAGECGRKER